MLSNNSKIALRQAITNKIINCVVLKIFTAVRVVIDRIHAASIDHSDVDILPTLGLVFFRETG